MAKKQSLPPPQNMIGRRKIQAQSLNAQLNTLRLQEVRIKRLFDKQTKYEGTQMNKDSINNNNSKMDRMKGNSQKNLLRQATNKLATEVLLKNAESQKNVLQRKNTLISQSSGAASLLHSPLYRGTPRDIRGRITCIDNF